MIVLNGHPRKKDPMRSKTQAASQLDIAVGRQEVIKSASSYECRPTVCSIAAVDVWRT
jgi:hypothetical protein